MTARAHEPAWREALATGRSLGQRYRLALPRESLRGPGGSRLGTLAGASLDFHDYRDYQPGDDLRHLDWNVYARSDKEIVKLYREEVAPQLDVVLDGSRSMALEGTGKAAAALTLAAACAAAADNAGCGHEVWLAGARVEPLAGSRLEPGRWALPAFEDSCPPVTGLAGSCPRLRRRGLRVFISDLLWPAEPEAALRRLADGAAALTVVQVLAREEESPALRGQHRFVDVESGERLDVFVDASACAAYAAALARHRERWSRACRRVGARLTTVTDDEACEGGRLRALERCGLLE